MRNFYYIVWLAISFNRVYGQGGCIPEVISYHYGANWGAVQNIATPLPNNYYMQHGDMNSFTGNEVISASTISQFTPGTGLAGTYRKFIKVHRMNLANMSTEEIKYTYNLNNNHVAAQVLSTFQSPSGRRMLTGSYGEDAGLIKQFDLDNSVHHDIHVEFTPPWNVPVIGTVITKVIEVDGFLYAIGYKHIHAGVEIYPFIARIPVNYFDNSLNCQMATGCNDVIIRSFPLRGLGNPPQGFFVDIRELNGEIYFCGSLDDHMVVGRWNANDATQFIMPVGAALTPQSMFNQMVDFNNELYLTYYSRRGPGAGILVLDGALNIQRQMSFDPAAYTLLPNTARAGAGIRVMPSTIEVIDNQNLLLGGYILDGRIHSFVVNVMHNNPALNNFGFLQKEGHFDVEPQPGLQKSNINDPNPNYRVFTVIDNDVYLANTTQLLSGTRAGFQGVYITRKTLMELQLQGQILQGPCHDLPEIRLNMITHEIQRGIPETMLRLDHDVSSFEDPVNEVGCVVQAKEDFKHWCPEDIQDDLDETACPYVNGIIVSQTINSSTNVIPPTADVRLCKGGCVNLRADINLLLGNTAANNNLRQYIWRRDGIDMGLPRNTCDIEVCDPDAGTYTLEVVHEESQRVCNTQFNIIVLPPIDAQILAMPSDYICQNQSSVLSLTDLSPVSYIWRKSVVYGDPIATFLSNGANITTSHPTSYSVEVEYPNGCTDMITKDIYREGLEISQNITETGSPNESLEITICNYNANFSANNIELTTQLAPANIIAGNLLGTGWSVMGTTYKYTVPTIGAAISNILPTCTTITMPVIVNKCATTNIVTADALLDPNFPCGIISSSRNYWNGSNFTPSLTASIPRSCNGSPITMTATPAGGANYVWFESGVTHGYFGSSNAQPINYITGNGAYMSPIQADVTINQCTKRTPIVNIGMSVAPPTVSANVTHKTCSPANNLGSIDLSLTPLGTYSYVWSTSASSEDISNLDPIDNQQYTVTITDAAGCTSTSTHTVNNNTPIAISIKREMVDCSNQVRYTATATGSSAPYTYTWYSASTGQILGSQNVFTNWGGNFNFNWLLSKNTCHA